MLDPSSTEGGRILAYWYGNSQVCEPEAVGEVPVQSPLGQKRLGAKIFGKKEVVRRGRPWESDTEV
jgi:hypothetical protein